MKNLQTNKIEKDGVHNKSVDNIKKYKLISILMGIALVVSLGITIGVVIDAQSKLEQADIPISEVMGENVNAGQATTDTEKQELISTIGKGLEGLKGKNLFVNVQDGEDSWVTLTYNKEGEVFAQASESGYITVYRKDKKAIRYTDYVDFGYDSDVLNLLVGVYDLARDGKCEVLKEGPEDNIEGYTQAIVDVRGWDNIQALYATIDAEFGKMMVDQLKQSLLEASASEKSGVNADDQTNFRFIFAMNKETSVLESAACYIYFGDKESTEIVWGDLSASWAFGGWKEVYDWGLTEDWYTTDWDKISEWENTDKAEEMLNTQYNAVMEMMNKWSIDNGYDPVLPGDKEEFGEDSSSSSSNESSSSSSSNESSSSNSSSSSNESSSSNSSNESNSN